MHIAQKQTQCFCLFRLTPEHIFAVWANDVKVEDRLPLGHGEKSVIILQSFIKLKRDEIFAIRFHMGAFDAAVKGGDSSMNKAYEMCPLAAMAHLADMEATFLTEKATD